MNDGNEFGQAPDERLGSLLRAHLTAGGDRTFTAAVMARVRREPQPRVSSWDVLAEWAPRGLAVAAMLALAVGLGIVAAPSDSPDPAGQAAGAARSPAELLTVLEPVSTEQVMTVVFEGNIGGGRD